MTTRWQAALDEAERFNAGAPITVFELLTAAAFCLFARVPAELVVLEVGLGGRYDATNVIPAPAAAAITSVSIDHRDFLGETLTAIAAEKAGVMKPGGVVLTGDQDPAVRAVLHAEAARVGARLLERNRDWTIAPTESGLAYADSAGALDLPPPALTGPHQLDNAGIAVAAARAGLHLPGAAIARGLATADWPARLQRLRGRLAATLPAGWELWLDGGHNPGAGLVLAAYLSAADRPVHLIVGMKKGKDSDNFLRPLLAHAASVWAVAEPGQHLAMPVEDIIAASGGVARPGPTVAGALASIPRQRPAARVLICGSLYLAGEVLKADETSVN